MSLPKDPQTSAARYRSGVAARLANMPPTTLRIWERRYGAIGPPKTASGQRLYSEQDVHRLSLLRQLVDQGYAIGTIANLETTALERMPRTPTGARPTAAALPGGVRLLIVGAALRQRLNKHVLEASDNVVYRDAIEDELLPVDTTATFDAVLVHAPSLQVDTARHILAFTHHYGAKALSVIYAFGTAVAIDSLRMAGAKLYRETAAMHELREIVLTVTRTADEAEAPSYESRWLRTPRRYSDQKLDAMSQRSSTIQCECPRHLSDLITQLAAFENYSDGCESRSPEDALLHRYLGDVSNRARVMFETALERLARDEGWMDALEDRVADA